MTEPASTDDNKPDPDPAERAVPQRVRVVVAVVVTTVTAACVVLGAAAAPARKSLVPMVAAQGTDRIVTPSSTPTGMAEPDPDDADILTRLKAAVLQHDEPLDSGSSVQERLAVNCEAHVVTDSRTVLAFQRRWNQPGPPDATVTHTVIAYLDEWDALSAVREVQKVVNAECATAVTASGSTWGIDSQHSSWGGWEYCTRVIAPADSPGYTCTGYRAHRDLVSRLTVTAPEGSREDMRQLYENLMGWATERLTDTGR